jgi:aromatase
MTGYTENSILILEDFDTVFDLTNAVEIWDQLFTEYQKVEILERNKDEIIFTLTTYPNGDRPSRSWTSRRIIDKKGKIANAVREENSFPFKTMNIQWKYEELPQNVGVVMTWIQNFELHKDCKWSVEELESFLNRNTREQMKSIKHKIEQKLVITSLLK